MNSHYNIRIKHSLFILCLAICIVDPSCEEDKKYDNLFALDYSGITEAKKEVIFSDSFDDNNNNWAESETGGFTFRIENGYYLIYSTTPFGPSKITDHYEEFQYFELECSIKIVDNPDSEYCGFTCSGDWYFFKDGSVKYNYDVIVSSTAVNPIGEYNKLVIRRIDGTIIYFLNDQKIGISHYRTKLNLIGFETGSNATIHVDYVKILKINL